MRDLRLYYGLEIGDVAQRIHIRTKYIQAIEEGRLEQLPGKVYTRGYIVTYAEFLGLDAEAFATQYLGEQAAAPATREVKYFVPEPKRVKMEASRGRWMYLAGAVVLAGVAFAFWPKGGDEKPAPETVTVAEVPEGLIQEMRSVVMPTAQRYDCLMGVGYLACLPMDRVWPEFGMVPPRQFVLADTEAEAAEMAPASAMDEALTVKEPEATPFVPEAKVESPAPKEPAVKTEEPSKTKNAEKDTAAKPVKAEAKPDAKTPVTPAAAVPFKTGPSVPENATQETPRAQAPVEPVTEVPEAPDDNTAADFWQKGLETPDPNAPRPEAWSPRGRR